MMVLLAAGSAAAATYLLYAPPVACFRPGKTTEAFKRRIQQKLMRLSWLWRRRGESARWRETTRQALGELVADLRAGQSAERATERSLTAEIAPRTVASIRWGGDVVAALRLDARASGRGVLAGVAACWSVAQSSGAGLADALERLIQQDRKAEEVRRQLAAHLAAPRATARMLALLPVFGMALGFLIGGDPLGWLVGTTPGWACLLMGGALTLLGLVWTHRIASRTESLL
jgi:tight adherence protein B